MESPELELQGAVYQHLIGDPSLTALIDGRVYDPPPEDAVFPYVDLGEAQTLRDDATCVSGMQIFLTLHAWSTDVGFPEVKRVAGAVVDALHLTPLSLVTYRLISLMHRQTRIFRDADGLTSHAVIEFVAQVEKPTA